MSILCIINQFHQDKPLKLYVENSAIFESLPE